MNNLMHNSFIL